MWRYQEEKFRLLHWQLFSLACNREESQLELRSESIDNNSKILALEKILAVERLYNWKHNKANEKVS